LAWGAGLSLLPAGAAAQVRRELGLAVVVAAADPWFAGVGPSGALHLSERVRLALVAAVGRQGNALAGRGELAAHFRATGLPGPVLFAGAGLTGTAGPRDAGYLLITLGVESRERARVGWSLELGVGGGVRLAGAWRVRFPRRG